VRRKLRLKEVAHGLKGVALISKQRNDMANSHERLIYVGIWAILSTVMQANDTTRSSALYYSLRNCGRWQDPIAADYGPHNRLQVEATLDGPHSKPAETIGSAQQAGTDARFSLDYGLCPRELLVNGVRGQEIWGPTKLWAKSRMRESVIAYFMARKVHCARGFWVA